MCEAFSNAANAWRVAVVNECGIDPDSPAASGLQRVPQFELTRITGHLHDAVRGILHYVRDPAAQLLVTYLAKWRHSAAEGEAALVPSFVATKLRAIERALTSMSEGDGPPGVALHVPPGDEQQAVKSVGELSTGATEGESEANQQSEPDDAELSDLWINLLRGMLKSGGGPFKSRAEIARTFGASRSTVTRLFQWGCPLGVLAEQPLRLTPEGERRVKDGCFRLQ